MTNFESNFPGALTSEEEMLADLQAVETYYQAMNVETLLLPSGEELELPMLLAFLVNPMDEDGPPNVLTNTFQPMGEEQIQGTKYFQMYGEIQVDDMGIAKGDLLELVNYCNSNTAGPMALYRQMDERSVVAIRMLQGFSILGSIDQIAFSDMVELYNVFSGMVIFLLEEMTQGKSLEEAKAEIGL